MKNTILLRHTLGHFCVDASCAAVVISATRNIPEATIFFVLYNFLAFCLQPFAGLLLDKFRRISPAQYVLISFILLLLGFIPMLNIWAKVLLVGIGNCLFHVGAGTVILTKAQKKMAPLGIFVSSGAMGLTLGTIFASKLVCHALLIGSIIALIIVNFNLEQKQIAHVAKKVHSKVAFLLCVCVTIRSFMGFMPLAQFHKTPEILVLITGGVVLGKMLGGILCDYYGIRKTVFISTGCVMLLFLFSFQNPYLWTIVQMIVNLSMPITLYLMYRSMPKYPAFSFGLAAACLVIGLVATWPLAHITFPPVCLLGLFVLNSYLILVAEGELK